MGRKGEAAIKESISGQRDLYPLTEVIEDFKVSGEALLNLFAEGLIDLYVQPSGNRAYSVIRSFCGLDPCNPQDRRLYQLYARVVEPVPQFEVAALALPRYVVPQEPIGRLLRFGGTVSIAYFPSALTRDSQGEVDEVIAVDRNFVPGGEQSFLGEGWADLDAETLDLISQGGVCRSKSLRASVIRQSATSDEPDRLEAQSGPVAGQAVKTRSRHNVEYWFALYPGQLSKKDLQEHIPAPLSLPVSVETVLMKQRDLDWVIQESGLVPRKRAPEKLLLAPDQVERFADQLIRTALVKHSLNDMEWVAVEHLRAFVVAGIGVWCGVEKGASPEQEACAAALRAIGVTSQLPVLRTIFYCEHTGRLRGKSVKWEGRGTTPWMGTSLPVVVDVWAAAMAETKRQTLATEVIVRGLLAGKGLNQEVLAKRLESLIVGWVDS